LEFFTNVTHEIRTPLTLIKGPVENLMELTDAVPEISEDVSTLNRATNRLLALINQILDFRKVENKKYSLYFSKVHIANLMQQEWEAFKPQAKKRGLRCSLELPSEAVYAFADEEALQKIFDNLYANAVKYAGSELHITLHLPKRHETTCTIEIRNDGTLIPAEARERIFESFSRLKSDEKPTGTGIGLTLARALAELHGGRLYLKEPSDGFNTFVFVLPLRHAATEAQQLSEDLKSFSIK
jgi:signal transduction histidine kinase